MEELDKALRGETAAPTTSPSIPVARPGAPADAVRAPAPQAGGGQLDYQGLLPGKSTRVDVDFALGDPTE
jgi:hypothetical protein